VKKKGIWLITSAPRRTVQAKSTIVF